MKNKNNNNADIVFWLKVSIFIGFAFASLPVFFLYKLLQLPFLLCMIIEIVFGYMCSSFIFRRVLNTKYSPKITPTTQ